MHWGIARLPELIAVTQLRTRLRASHAAEYHFREGFGSHVTTGPSGIEILGGHGRDHFIHRFSCCDEILNPVPDLHQHVTVVLQIGARGQWTMSRNDFCLFIGLRQNLI